MISPLRLLRVLSVTAPCFLTALSPVAAQDLTPPTIVQPVADFTVTAGTAQSVIKLNRIFGLTGVTGNVVRFSTTEGTIDVELFANSAPKTVAQFLTYANNPGANAAGSYSYTNTLIQRAIPGFVVQGGGYFVDSDSIEQIVGRPTIPSEAGVKNTRGTLAIALSNGPNSGTGDFFFNIADNPLLDGTADGGPFTVFGRVVGSLATLDSIAALPQQDLSSQLGGSFSNVPLVNYSSGQSISVANLVYLNGITPIATIGKRTDDPSLLRVQVSANSNPGLVTPTIIGSKLFLVYSAGQTGTATIKLKAKDTAGSAVRTTFHVTVQ